MSDSETEIGFIQTPMPGVYRDVPATEYHRWDAMSKTWLGYIEDESPKHFHYRRAHPKVTTEAMLGGQVLHKLCLEALDFADEFVVAPKVDRRTKVGKAAWADFERLSERKVVIEQGQYDTSRAMARSLMRHKIARELLADGQAELSIVWDDPDTGIRCKARLDYFLPPMIGDVKRARKVSEHGFSSAVAAYGYHRQAAMYLDGGQIVKLDAKVFAFATVETEEPYDVVVYVADEKMILAGRKSYKRALFTYKHCLETNEWPGRAEHEVVEIGLPNYILADEGLLERIEL